MPTVDNAFVDPDLIEALYQNPANSVLLAEYAMRTGGVQLGLTSSGGVERQDNVIAVTLIQGQGGGGSGDGGGGIIPGCPRVDQWITVRGESEFDLVSKQAGSIRRGQYLFDRMGNEWNRVASTEILHNVPMWGVAANDRNKRLVTAYSSGTHPIFRSLEDRGAAVQTINAGGTVVIGGNFTGKLLACLLMPERGDVVRIELETGHRYEYADSPVGERIACHNAKQPQTVE